MCSPAAMGVASGLQVMGGLYSAGQMQQEGKATRNYYNLQADTLEKNAEIVGIQADRKVTNIQDRAALETRKFDDQVKTLEGSQTVAAAASGIGAGSVSSEDIARDTMSKAALDKALIRYNADLESEDTQRNAKFEAGNMRIQAKQLRYAGKMAQKSAKMNSYTSLFNTATQTGTNWMLYNK